MKIDTSTWKTFFLHELFDAGMGNGFDRNKMSDDNPTVNYVTRTAENNGVGDVIDYVAGVEPYPAGSITLALGGSIGSTFIQTSPFYTGQNVAVLRDKNNLSYETKLFIVSIIKKECSVRFCAFGRELNVHYKTDFTLSLPATSDGKPDWQWMEDYIKSLRSEPIKTANTSGSLSIDTAKWNWFKLGSLIDEIYKADAHSKTDLYGVSDSPKDDYVPFVTRTEENNAVDCYVDAKEVKVEKGNALVIGDTTSTVSYQSKPFSTGDHIVVIRASWLNEITGLFLVALLQRERFRYSYGRAFVMDSIKDTSIKLPATSTGEPDWEWMESYMKSLPYGDRIG